MEIDWLRRKIDELDVQILELINKRAEFALEIGELKRARGLSILSPQREEELLTEIRKKNKGPMKDDAIGRVYEKIIEETRALQMNAVADASDIRNRRPES